MDELMMNLFSLIADQVRDKQELFDDEGKIMQMLLNGGYDLHEADAALTLMQTLVQKQAENFFSPDQAASPAGMRAMNSEERRRLTPEAFAFAVKLTHLGILTESQREDILERAMGMSRARAELDQVKALTAFLLFSGMHDHEDDEQFGHRAIRHTAWN